MTTENWVGIIGILGGGRGQRQKKQADPLLLPALAGAGPDYSFLLPRISWGAPLPGSFLNMGSS